MRAVLSFEDEATTLLIASYATPVTSPWTTEHSRWMHCHGMGHASTAVFMQQRMAKRTVWPSKRIAHSCGFMFHTMTDPSVEPVYSWRIVVLNVHPFTTP